MLDYWTLTNKPQWNFNQNTKHYFHENASENIFCEIAAIMSRDRRVNPEMIWGNSSMHLCYPNLEKAMLLKFTSGKARNIPWNGSVFLTKFSSVVAPDSLILIISSADTGETVVHFDIKPAFLGTGILMKIQTITRCSYIYHGNSYSGKKASSYWNLPAPPSGVVFGLFMQNIMCLAWQG